VQASVPKFDVVPRDVEPWSAGRESATAPGARCQTSSSCMRVPSCSGEAGPLLREFLRPPNCSRAAPSESTPAPLAPGTAVTGDAGIGDITNVPQWHPQRGAGRHQHSSFHKVLQLPDVAWPSVLAMSLHGFPGDPVNLLFHSPSTCWRSGEPNLEYHRGGEAIGRWYRSVLSYQREDNKDVSTFGERLVIDQQSIPKP
jgi:hypothetical protein